ncbi:hypothetical protein B0I75DRAFT_154839 [Yarrowia lipolytica]|nr:hypothetical protein B0I74DRAFT_149021 [Yarrowia lipolytica]RDW49856.1 hypothetical protein B0I75DRAFT_154839 [Yarrowia lipolytica]
MRPRETRLQHLATSRHPELREPNDKSSVTKVALAKDIVIPLYSTIDAKGAVTSSGVASSNLIVDILSSESRLIPRTTPPMLHLPKPAVSRPPDLSVLCAGKSSAITVEQLLAKTCLKTEIAEVAQQLLPKLFDLRERESQNQHPIGYSNTFVCSRKVMDHREGIFSNPRSTEPESPEYQEMGYWKIRGKDLVLKKESAREVLSVRDTIDLHSSSSDEYDSHSDYVPEAVPLPSSLLFDVATHITKDTPDQSLSAPGTSSRGELVIYTPESENIKTFLVKQFSDYDLGKTRHALLFTLMGDRIFTLDGQGWEH